MLVHSPSVWTQTDADLRRKWNESDIKRTFFYGCGRVLGRPVCPFYHKRMYTDRMGLALELA